MRLEHSLHASHIECKARFEQHGSLEAKVEDLLRLGQLLSIFQIKRRTLMVHREPEHFVVAGRSMSHAEANVEHVALKQICYLYGVRGVRHKGEMQRQTCGTNDDMRSPNFSTEYTSKIHPSLAMRASRASILAVVTPALRAWLAVMDCHARLSAALSAAKASGSPAFKDLRYLQASQYNLTQCSVLRAHSTHA